MATNTNSDQTQSQSALQSRTEHLQKLRKPHRDEQAKSIAALRKAEDENYFLGGRNAALDSTYPANDINWTLEASGHQLDQHAFEVSSTLTRGIDLPHKFASSSSLSIHCNS